ncbi:hypothetical protein IG631_24086 [Alternaria alternata]|nr:hypothetical protein IG631_24086 [Alternaria alternata]
MEPPAKRMRIHQSVRADGENLDYVGEKQRNQQRLRSQFESIFEKSGNIHESQSNEIDMKTNKVRVVVDRGHPRRLQRKSQGKEKRSLDSLGVAVRSEEEEVGEDSEDELAPTQLVKSKTTN